MHKKFGEYLIEQKLVNQDELDKALKLQEKNNVKLGQIFFQKGLISEEDILDILADQYQMPYQKNLDTKGVDKVVHLVPRAFVQKYRMVPYFIAKNSAKVAVYDPTEFHAIDEIRLMMSAYHVEFFLARETEILRVIHSHFEESQDENEDQFGLEETFENFGGMEDLQDSMDLANQAPIIKMVNVILSNAVTERASDIHIEPMERELTVRYRVDGILHKIFSPPKAIQSGIISRIKIMANLNIAETRLPQDGRIKIRFGGKDIDIRVSSLPTQFGERIVMRLLNKTDANYSLEILGLSKENELALRNLLSNPNGIVLVTGPTGSGKTTTLYAALTELNKESSNIVTVEDPIEYQINGINQVQARPKIGLTFAEGLRSILRQDPDVIMVGEIRDEETARVAIQSALTGHLVFSTLHTNDAPSAVTRLLDMGIENYLITSTLQGVIAQRLVRRLCSECKKKTKITMAELKKIGWLAEGQKSDSTSSKKTFMVYEAVGCKICMNTGYRGRIGIYELLLVDNQIRSQVLQDPSLDQLRKVSINRGMCTLRQAAINGAINGDTSLDEALRVT